MLNISDAAENSGSIQGQVVTITVMLIFSIIVGWGLLAGSIAPAQGSLWLGVACLFPIGWYCYGYLRVSDSIQSNALLVNIIGWVFVATGFLVHYKAVLEADPGTLLSAISTTPSVALLLAALFILLIGGLLSWQATTKPQSLETEPTP
ncbi:MAG: hypothetical protein ABI210_00625 [Abditibacteriaceae bacterium]